MFLRLLEERRPSEAMLKQLPVEEVATRLEQQLRLKKDDKNG